MKSQVSVELEENGNIENHNRSEQQSIETGEATSEENNSQDMEADSVINGNAESHNQASAFEIISPENSELTNSLYGLNALNALKAHSHCPHCVH